MLDLLDGYDGSAAARQRLAEGLAAVHKSVMASARQADPDQVARAEDDVKADPARCIRIDHTGAATVYAAGRRYQGGRFETPRLCELRTRALDARDRASTGERTGGPSAALRLWVVDGAGPITDIGALQATAPPGALFQVASQFNCLESPDRFVTEVAAYFDDPTQGPRAAISAFPGALVRHYAARGPGGGRFVQVTNGAQVQLLADVCDPGVAWVHNGYLRASDIPDPPALARALEDRFEAVRVGVHDGVEVALGYNWIGAVAGAPHRTIAQVLTSTLAAGMYGALDGDGRDGGALATICRQLQRAAYLGTLLAAAALGKDYAVLTLIGGGVFGNPIAVIWDAIVWATEQVRHALHRDLTVVVNGRDIGDHLPRVALAEAARDRGGALVRIERDGSPIIAA